MKQKGDDVSEIFTVASLRGHPGSGLMERGRLPRNVIIAHLRAYYLRQKEEAERVLATPDNEIDCRIVRGSIVQHLIERLDP